MSDSDQVRFLNEASRKVKEQAFFMKRAMDADDLKATLNHASDMLRELRTSLLTPKNYYELYMKVRHRAARARSARTHTHDASPPSPKFRSLTSCGP